jgi:hypothetical protein
MFQGRVRGIVPNQGTAERTIGLLMTGAEAA